MCGVCVAGAARYLAAVYGGLLQLVGENIDPKTNTEKVFAIAIILCVCVRL